jgi:CheY-like chemotaxis protein
MTHENLERKLKILVVEDTPANIDAAKEQLKAHDLEILTTYEDAATRLTSEYQEKGAIDVLMTDLYVPFAQKDGGRQVWREDVTKTKALGYPLILLGVQQKIPKIGLLSDSNHHSSSEAAAADYFNGERPTPTTIGSSIVYMSLRNFADTNYTKGIKEYAAALDHIIEYASWTK